MKTESALFRSFGVLVALLVFLALPSSTALAVPCYPSHDPYCELYYGIGTQLFLELETDCPTYATLFVRTALDSGYPPDPCHDSNGNPCSGTSALSNGTKLSVPYGHTLYVKVLAWSSGTGDSNIVSCEQHNPNN